MRLQMIEFDKIFGKFWGPFLSRFQDAEKISAFKEVIPDLEKFFQKNLQGSDYLSGSTEPMMIDIHCYPMVERIVMLEHSPWSHGFEAIGMKDAPTIIAYVERFKANPKFAPHAMTQDAYNKLLAKWDTLEPGVKQGLMPEFI